MCVEYAQILSTAHRVLDGYQEIEERYVLGSLPARWRKCKIWKLDDDKLNGILYKSTHVNHPSSIWARASAKNYLWLAELLEQLCKEYTHRYGKIHKVEYSGLMQTLKNNIPKNIGNGSFTDPTPAMPDECKCADSLTSYRNYYINNKDKISVWTKREPPSWFIEGVMKKDAYVQLPLQEVRQLFRKDTKNI